MSTHAGEIKCAFCNKASLEKQLILETENFIIIHARRPLSRGHCLIIPTAHTPEGIGINPALGEELLTHTNRIFKALHKAFDAIGYNFFINIGTKAGQEVSHAHFHILPRYENETISPFAILNSKELSAQREKLDPETLEKEIETIKNNL